MGSTAVDNAGNLAVGYSTSSTSVFPSIAYAGRLLTDPPGTLGQGEATMFSGTGVQQLTSNRWGDYTAMCLDPADDATFWYTNQYYSTTGQFLWKTKIGAFKFAGTTAPPQGTFSGTITACDIGVPLTDALVQVTGGPSTGFSAASKPDGTYSMNLSPGSYSATIVDPAHSCNAIGPFPVVITAGNTTTLNKCLSGVASFVFGSGSVSLSGGNGNGIIEPNECNDLDVSILNDGCLLGSAVSAVLSTTTPEVTIAQANSAYPDVAENAMGTNTTPFKVSTSSSFLCGTTIDFTLTVNFAGGSSVFSFSIPTCTQPAAVINGSLDVSDPVQEGRLGRNGLVSGCGTAKACPGPLGTGNRRYDVYSFANGPMAACASVSLTATNTTAGGNILSVAYLNNYVPPVVGMTGNICINYLGDPGGSPALNSTATFSVDMPANQTLVVVVEETNLAQPAGSTYTLQVSGLVGNGTGPGPCPPAANLVRAASRVTHGGAGSFDIDMPLTGPSGIEDRLVSNYTAVFTFDIPVTSGTVTVSSGTATVGAITFSGNEMRANLSGVADVQPVVLHTENINGDGQSHGDVPFGFLAGDVTGNRVVDKPDANSVATNQGNTTAANFRNDVNADGKIKNNSDGKLVKARKGHSLP